MWGTGCPRSDPCPSGCHLPPFPVLCWDLPKCQHQARLWSVPPPWSPPAAAEGQVLTNSIQMGEYSRECHSVRKQIFKYSRPGPVCLHTQSCHLPNTGRALRRCLGTAHLAFLLELCVPLNRGRRVTQGDHIDACQAVMLGKGCW